MDLRFAEVRHPPANPSRRTSSRPRFASAFQGSFATITVGAEGVAMLSVLIGVLIICVVGAICFWAIEKFINDSRLANLLKLLVVLICAGAILQRVLPLAGINWF